MSTLSIQPQIALKYVFYYVNYANRRINRIFYAPVRVVRVIRGFPR